MTPDQFIYTDMIKFGNSQKFCKNNRKNNTGGKDQEQDFLFQTQFHVKMIYITRLFDKTSKLLSRPKMETVPIDIMFKIYRIKLSD